MKVFVYNNTLVLADKIESFNKWLTSKGKLPIKNPNIQDVPDDCDIKDFENGIFSQALYDARKEAELKKRYDDLVQKYIHIKYPIDKEMEIVFEQHKNPTAVEEHNAYVEECKEKAKREVYGK
jgi:hypothetical protein